MSNEGRTSSYNVRSHSIAVRDRQEKSLLAKPSGLGMVCPSLHRRPQPIVRPTPRHRRLPRLSGEWLARRRRHLRRTHGHCSTPGGEQFAELSMGELKRLRVLPIPCSPHSYFCGGAANFMPAPSPLCEDLEGLQTCHPLAKPWFLVGNRFLGCGNVFTRFATRNQSSLAATFQGWSVEIHPVRSTERSAGC
jgi:hypothetical protein